MPRRSRGFWRGSRLPDRVLNLAGKTNLGELAALFSLADLVITPDTGPMHLAAAVKAPLIALFGPTAPWRTGPYGNGHAVLRKELPCSPCFRKKCPTGECLDQITVEEVLKAAEEKLRERRSIMALSKDLLEIIACPKCVRDPGMHGRPGIPGEGESADLPALSPGLPDRRRHPDHADRRGHPLA